MDIQEYISKLKELATQGAERSVEAIVVPAANELLASIKNRIIQEGQKSDGTKIGNYSTKPIYVEKEQFIEKSKFRPRGKTGETKFKSGALHKSMYLESGYSQLRSIQGRPVDKINEFYTGDTMNSYQLSEDGETILLGFVNERASIIRQGQESKRGKIFYATEQELKHFNDNILKSTQEQVIKIFNA